MEYFFSFAMGFLEPASAERVSTVLCYRPMALIILSAIKSNAVYCELKTIDQINKENKPKKTKFDLEWQRPGRKRCPNETIRVLAENR